MSETIVRIGLMRHFAVSEPFPSGWRTAADLHEWINRYDMADTQVGEFDLGGIPWQKCLSSDMPRTRITAEEVFAGEIEFTNLLREPQFQPFKTGRLRLPIWAWKWVLRTCWMTGHRSQRVCRDDFRLRVLAVADRLSAVTADTLVVSHAGMMSYLSAELRRRGFQGPKLRIAKHARVYVYQRNGW